MKNWFKRQPSDGRKGQAVVEFALILPVFVLLVFGAIELGRAYYVKHLLTNAAREGARVGSLPNQLEADVHDRIQEFLTGVGLGGTWGYSVVVKNPAGVLRTGGLVNAIAGDRVTVTITYTFQVLVGTVIPGFTGNVPLNNSCTFRHE